MNRTPVPAEFRQPTAKITQNQRSYILDLLEKKDLSDVDVGRVDSLYKSLRISEDPEEFGMGKAQASEVISWLISRPAKPRNEQETARREGRAEDLSWQKPLEDLPPGRYAIENNEGELRFYQRWQGKGSKSDRFALYVMFGPYEAKLPRNAQVAIAKKILEAGVRECAIRFGNEIGSCSNCGRRLTNRISRELGIGPVCGGRMFGDSPEKAWRDMVNEARDAIIARGEDPEEELDE